MALILVRESLNAGYNVIRTRSLLHLGDFDGFPDLLVAYSDLQRLWFSYFSSVHPTNVMDISIGVIVRALSFQVVGKDLGLLIIDVH